MTVQIALYKGPPGTWLKGVTHRLICRKTKGPYSHCELIDSENWCWSSSFWDGGVRRKQINVYTDHWDIITVEGDLDSAVGWFKAHDGQPYGWWGLLTSPWVLPFRISDNHSGFCSKSLAAALGRPNAWRVSPNDIAGWAL